MILNHGLRPVANSFFVKELSAWVVDILQRNRGREPPGMYNPVTVGELFHQQSLSWQKQARRF